MNVLFVCSKNKWRSRTAEMIYKNHEKLSVKSAGTDEGAVVKLSAKHLSWADLVFVMEDKHRQLIKKNFRREFDEKKMIVLDIPDEYQFMDEELIETLKLSVGPYLTEEDD